MLSLLFLLHIFFTSNYLSISIDNVQQKIQIFFLCQRNCIRRILYLLTNSNQQFHFEMIQSFRLCQRGDWFPNHANAFPIKPYCVCNISSLINCMAVIFHQFYSPDFTSGLLCFLE